MSRENILSQISMQQAQLAELKAELEKVLEKLEQISSAEKELSELETQTAELITQYSNIDYDDGENWRGEKQRDFSSNFYTTIKSNLTTYDGELGNMQNDLVIHRMRLIEEQTDIERQIEQINATIAMLSSSL